MIKLETSVMALTFVWALTASIGQVHAFEIVNGADANEYVISWDAAGPVDIFVSPDPTASPTESKQIAQALDTGTLTWRANGAPGRRYFTLRAKDATQQAAVRLLPLEGGRNFRDLGGYTTEDGRTVKWGHIYRSGVMAGLTDADYDYLASLNIAAICDYRAAEERENEPTNWRAGEVEYITFPDPESEAGSSFMSALQDPGATPEKVAAAMAAGYSQIAKQHAPAYRVMFDKLAAGEIPLAFNCSAGKDRAGISSALLLTALGVPRATVIEDYALSEKLVDYMQEFVGSADDAAEQREDGGAYDYLMKMPRELLAPLMRSDPQYIKSTFKDLEAEHGSVMAFIREELDVTDAELASIRGALLK